MKEKETEANTDATFSKSKRKRWFPFPQGLTEMQKGYSHILLELLKENPVIVK